MVVVREDKTQAKTKPFPKLMISKTGTVIIARGYDDDLNSSIEGTVLLSVHSDPQGHHSKNFSARIFSDYTGTLTLSNE